MVSFSVPIWKKAPFLRLLLPVIIGIILQWYLQFDLYEILFAAICFSIPVFLFRFFPSVLQYNFKGLQGLFINLTLIAFGLFLTYQKDIRHKQNWYGNVYHDSDYLAATINEPLLEKNKTYKAEAVVENTIHNDAVQNTTGKIIIYFQKDSLAPLNLQYGDEILIRKKLQEIKNSGNPGAFNYQRYSAFHQVFNNIYLKNNDWVLLKEKHINAFQQFIFSSRQSILNILQRNMHGHDDQLSIAEALLIGYTQDLDKDLVQAYSNTGVVHIIAISGMHLGLIYVLLLWIFKRIPFIRRSKIVEVIFILSGLWLFALLTGGGASIIRAAVMFTFLIIGKNLGRNKSSYNSLAASAFILLCYNPYFLWDVGFQLSYLAILGILMFQKPIYHLLFIKNKQLNYVWELMSLSTAAQILTFPICLYYFHQFPTVFLLTNIILVPLSTVILFVEISLITFSWIPFFGTYIGKLTWWLVWLMNKIILWFNNLPYSLWDRISSTLLSTLFLYGFVLCIGYWLLNKNKNAFRWALCMLAGFTFLTAYASWQTSQQQKMIVYNVPQHQSIDFIDGNTFKFIGDSVLQEDGMLQNFHLKPGRIALQLNKETNSFSSLYQANNFFQFNGKKILLIDKPVVFVTAQQKINIDYIVISKNPKLYISRLQDAFICTQYIFDGSNSLWKIAQWKKDCEKLHLRSYSVPEQGAFVLDL